MTLLNPILTRRPEWLVVVVDPSVARPVVVVHTIPPALVAWLVSLGPLLSTIQPPESLGALASWRKSPDRAFALVRAGPAVANSPARPTGSHRFTPPPKRSGNVFRS